MGILFGKKKKQIEEENTLLEEDIVLENSEENTESKVDQYLLAEPTEEPKKKKRGLAKETTEISEEELEEYIAEVEETENSIRKIEEQMKNKLTKSLLKGFLTPVYDEYGNNVNENITDVSFNGTHLYVQDNKKGRYRVVQDKENTPEKLIFNSANIHGLMHSIASVNGIDFTISNPIIDTEMEGFRINAVHPEASPYGCTMSIRISRPTLAINENNVETLAPIEVINFLQLLMRINENLLISGMTGSGKTEFQKFLVGSIRKKDKVSLMEDTMDSHIKELYPDHDINSWRTLLNEARIKKIGFPELIKAGLRNNPDRLMISEIRGGKEAYNLLVATLTGHSVLTTLHSYSAQTIPSRLRSMIGQEYSLDAKILGEDIVNHLPFGTHLEMIYEGNEIIRRIKEVVEYMEYKDDKVVCNVIFSRKTKCIQDLNSPDGLRYEEETYLNPLSEKTIQKFKDKKVYHLLSPKLIPKPKSKKDKPKSNIQNINFEIYQKL